MIAMLARLREPLAAASFLALVAASPAAAQADRTWVDPPARADGSSQPSPGPSSQAPAPQASAEPATPLPKVPPTQPAEPAPQPNVQSAQPSEPAPPRPAAPSREAAPSSRPVAPASPELKASPAPKRTAQPDVAAPPKAPPVRSVRRSRPAALPEPEVAARPQGGERPAGAAQQLAIDYLGYWSAPNAIALGATPDFYAPKVLFHGRVMSARALAEEKRRFIQRWPQRYYTPRLGTLRTTCDPGREVCTVRTLFDFTALNPAQGAQSRGTANLELGVSFASGRPVIVFETSHVIRRGRSARSAFLDDAE